MSDPTPERIAANLARVRELDAQIDEHLRELDELIQRRDALDITISLARAGLRDLQRERMREASRG